MLKATYVQKDGTETTLDVDEGTSLMRAAVVSGVQGIVGECGGQAMCATCHVYVREEFLLSLPPASEDEEDMLEGTAALRTERSRLSCQIKACAKNDTIIVDIPDRQN